MRTAILTSIVVLFVFIVAPTSVLACSCAERQTQDKEIESSENVFVGQIVDTVAPASPKEGYPYGDSGFSIVVIEKVYKGNLKAGDRFSISNGDGLSCAYSFGQGSVGQTWLLYMSKPYPRSVFDPASRKRKETGDMKTSVSFCGRSDEVKRSSHDLAYLDNIDKYNKYKGKNRLSGKLMQLGRDVPDVVGMWIKIVGKQRTYTALVLESGFFEIYDLPNGEYIVEFETPPGWKLGERYYNSFTTYPNRFDDEGLSSNQRRVVIGEGHYTLDFSLELDSAN